MRRRAASHNIHRLPTRLRLKALREYEAAGKPSTDRKKPSCRRRVRRERWMKERPRDGGNYLETHLWHAKRGHMTKIGSMRVCQSSHMKALKSSIRAAEEGCFLHDASYEGLLMVHPSALSLLRPVEGMIYCLDAVGARCVAWSHGDTVCYWWLHPLLMERTMLYLQEQNVQYQVGPRFNLFDLRGPLSLQKLEVLLGQFDGKSVNLEAKGIHACFHDSNRQFPVQPVTHVPASQTEEKPLIPGTKIDSGERIPVCLLKLTDKHHYRLVCPVGFGWSAWRVLVSQKGVRFGGQQELRQVALVQGWAQGPRDAVGTIEHSAWWAEQGQEEHRIQQSKPPAKRLNFYHYRSEYATLIPLLPLDVQLWVMEVEGRGVALPGAIIYEKGEEGARIGIVCNGGYSQRHGRGRAIVAIWSTTSVPQPVFFRNRTSWTFYPARLLEHAPLF